MMHRRLASLAILAAASLALPAQADEAKLQKYGCVACHKLEGKMIGPGFKDIAAKYKGDPAAADRLAAKVRSGGSGVWGAMAMPPHPAVSDADMKAMIAWILAH
jgi:cytochrome c